MQTVPLIDTYAQTLKVILAAQPCRIDIYQKSTGVYCDLYVRDIAIVLGVICRNGVRIVRSSYLGFIGDLAFLDGQGSEDPRSPGIGTRFELCYIEASEL